MSINDHPTPVVADDGATDAQLGYRPRLPDFCNLGIMLRMVVVVNIMVIGAALSRGDLASEMSGFLRQFLMISIVAQPAIIFSLVASCGLKPVLSKLTYWRAFSSINA